MVRFATLTLCAGLCLAQTPVASQTAVPPEVDQALRARISEFYQDHVDGKFRQAEALVAEESKDYYYAANKPKYIGFEISRIEYSDDFTRAKAVVACGTYIMAPGFLGHPLKVPIASTWKLVDGQWYWYVDQNQALQTPFGKMTPGKGAPPSGDAAPALPTQEQMQALAQQLANLVKADKESITLKTGQSEAVTLTNNSTGTMSLVLAGKVDGVHAELDRRTLKPKERATLSVQAGEGAKSGTFTIQVEQTNQVIPVQVHIQ